MESVGTNSYTSINRTSRSLKWRWWEIVANRVLSIPLSGSGLVRRRRNNGHAHPTVHRRTEQEGAWLDLKTLQPVFTTTLAAPPFCLGWKS